MTPPKFRMLNANEIDVRVAMCTAKGASLLLYKDARVDQNILDETVGAMNWQRDHKELKNNMYCGVSIWDEDKSQWVTKWDAGKESFSDGEKGEASDSFKRACFNWGIGRELYSSPFIWVMADKIQMGEKNGKPTCNDSFKVEIIRYNDKGEISVLSILNKKGERVFTYKEPPAIKESK